MKFTIHSYENTKCRSLLRVHPQQKIPNPQAERCEEYPIFSLQPPFQQLYYPMNIPINNISKNKSIQGRKHTLKNLDESMAPGAKELTKEHNLSPSLQLNEMKRINKNVNADTNNSAHSSEKSVTVYSGSCRFTHASKLPLAELSSTNSKKKQIKH